MRATKRVSKKLEKLRVCILIPSEVHEVGKLLAEQDYRSLSAEIVTLIEAEAARREHAAITAITPRKRKPSSNGNGNGSTPKVSKSA